MEHLTVTTVVYVVLVIATFLLVWAVTRWADRAFTDPGGICDRIIATTEPFVAPDDTPDPRHLRIVTDQPPLKRARLPQDRLDVLTLAMPPATIQTRRQAHRNDFCDLLLRHLGTVPNRGQADRWWPGTVPSPAERRYDR